MNGIRTAFVLVRPRFTPWAAEANCSKSSRGSSSAAAQTTSSKPADRNVQPRQAKNAASPPLIVATFIDFDRMEIPDGATVPAMLFAFVVGTAVPQVHLVPVWFSNPDLLRSILPRESNRSPIARQCRRRNSTGSKIS